MASYWKWSCVVEANGRRQLVKDDAQGPDHATEDKIRIGVELLLDRAYPRGYVMTDFMATRIA